MMAANWEMQMSTWQQRERVSEIVVLVGLGLGLGLGLVGVVGSGCVGTQGSVREAEGGCCRGSDSHGSGRQLRGEAAVTAELARSTVGATT